MQQNEQRATTPQDPIVHRWAAENMVSGHQALEVYDNWSAEGINYSNDENLRSALSTFFLHSRETASSCEKRRESYESLRTTWGIETVKHLALVNLAGIAGILTLLSTDKGKGSLIVPLALFALGAMTSIMGFLTAGAGNGALADAEGELQRLRWYATKWDHLTDLVSYNARLEAAAPCFIWAKRSVICSLAATFIAVISLLVIQY